MGTPLLVVVSVYCSQSENRTKPEQKSRAKLQEKGSGRKLAGTNRRRAEYKFSGLTGVRPDWDGTLAAIAGNCGRECPCGVIRMMPDAI
jgi:hypothetical protein